MNHFALQLFPSHSTISCPHFFLFFISFFFSPPHALITLHTKWSRPSDQRALPLTSDSEHLLLDSWAFGRTFGWKKYSVSPMPHARGWTSASLSSIIHSFSKPTYSCSGTHGAGGLVGSSERFTFHIQVSSSTLNAQFSFYRRSVIIHYHYIIDVR